MTSLKFWKGVNRAYDRLLTVILGIILLIACYCIYDSYWVYSHADDDSLLKYKPTAPGYDPDDSPITQDMVGWITIDDTNIDYPVMQADDNVKYLNTDPLGKYSLSGSIFLDCSNSPDFSDDYSLLYGHHMEYGKMFGALDDFLDEEYLREHRSGELIIGRDGSDLHTLSVFAAMKADSSDDEVFTTGNPGRAEFIEKNAVVFIGEPKGRVVALSTCADGDTTARTLVFCYIKE